MPGNYPGKLVKFFFFFFFLSFVLLELHLWHMEVPRLGVNQSCCCQPTPEPQQCQIWAMSATYTTAHGNSRSFKPLSETRDRICNLMVPSWIRFPCATTGTPGFLFLDPYCGCTREHIFSFLKLCLHAHMHVWTLCVFTTYIMDTYKMLRQKRN